VQIKTASLLSLKMRKSKVFDSQSPEQFLVPALIFDGFSRGSCNCKFQTVADMLLEKYKRYDEASRPVR